MSSFKKGLGLLVSSNNSPSSWLEPFALSVCIYCANLHVSLAPDCLWDQVMDCWLVPQLMIIFSSRLFKKILKLKIEARPVNAGLYTPFHHNFSFATVLAANFGCNRLRVMPEIVQSVCTPASEVDVLFDSNQLESKQRFYFLKSRRFRSASGFNLEDPDIFPCFIFTQRLVTHCDWYEDWAKL